MFHGNCFDDELIPTGSVNLVLCDPPSRVRLAKNTMSRRLVLRALILALLSLCTARASSMQISLGRSHTCAVLEDGAVM